MIDLPPPTYEETVQAIVQCDIARANVSIEYADLMQSDVVTISDLGEMSDLKLRCLRAAIHPFYILTIEDEEQSEAFYEFSRREDRSLEKAQAREWLRARGMLGRVPAFDPDQPIEQFAAALESACELDEGSVLTSLGPSTLTFKPEYLQDLDYTTADNSLSCITRMFAASDAADHDISLGFIGNEAVEEGDGS
ncbi:MAG: hypothetical protein LC634_07885 [Sphingomonadales bacterium]|nr:hypothetical protein [Sphingomonadales bacterium]